MEVGDWVSELLRGRMTVLWMSVVAVDTERREFTFGAMGKQETKKSVVTPRFQAWAEAVY